MYHAKKEKSYQNYRIVPPLPPEITAMCIISPSFFMCVYGKGVIIVQFRNLAEYLQFKLIKLILIAKYTISCKGPLSFIAKAASPMRQSWCMSQDTRGSEADAHTVVETGLNPRIFASGVILII